MDFVHNQLEKSNFIDNKGCFQGTQKKQNKKSEYHPFYSELMITDWYVVRILNLCEFKLKQSNEIFLNAVDLPIIKMGPRGFKHVIFYVNYNYLFRFF